MSYNPSWPGYNMESPPMIAPGQQGAPGVNVDWSRYGLTPEQARMLAVTDPNRYLSIINQAQIGQYYQPGGAGLEGDPYAQWLTNRMSPEQLDTSSWGAAAESRGNVADQLHDAQTRRGYGMAAGAALAGFGIPALLGAVGGGAGAAAGSGGGSSALPAGGGVTAPASLGTTGFTGSPWNALIPGAAPNAPVGAGAFAATGGVPVGAGMGATSSGVGGGVGSATIPPGPTAGIAQALGQPQGQPQQSGNGIMDWINANPGAAAALGIGAAGVAGASGAFDTPNVPIADPLELINAQAQANRIDQNTPWGSLTYSGPNRSTANLNLDPRLQGILNSQMGLDQSLLGQAQGMAGQLPNSPLQPGQLQGQVGGLNLSGLSSMPGAYDPYRAQSERAFFDRSSGLLNEQFGRDEERLRQTLANQGLQAGGEAFGQEMGTFNQRRGETFSNLARDATLFGGQEASRGIADQLSMRGQGYNEALGQFGAGLQQGEFGNQAAMNQFGMNQTARANQFGELAGLLGLQQTQMPNLNNFYPPSQLDTNSAFGLQQAGRQNQYNADTAKKGGTAGLLGTLGSAWLGA